TQNAFYETYCFYIDSTFFDLFTYEFKYGDIHTALDLPNSIILTEPIAIKLFGDIDPVNKVIKVGLSFGEFDYTVKGVLKSTANTSHIPANAFLSMNNGDIGSWVIRQTNWANNNIFHTYFKLKSGADIKDFESKLPGFLDRNGGADLKAMGFLKTLFTQKMQDIYLHSNFGFEIAPNGNIKYIYLFSTIALFLLLIACINFMNLSTARSEKRAAEVGMRKVVGAYKHNLIRQFLSESILMSFIALVVTMIFIRLITPAFNQLTHKQLSLFDNPWISLMVVGLTLVTALVSGIYPAFYLASFKPIAVLKGKIKNNYSVVTIRKGLIVFQFFISTVLIFGAILINTQMKYMSSFALGFDKKQKIVLPLQTKESDRNYKVLYNTLAQDPVVISSGRGTTYPGIEHIQDMLFYSEGKTKNENVDIVTVQIDDGYFKTLGFELLKGRTFSKEFTNDTLGLVLNEAAIQKLGFTIENAIGKKAMYDFRDQVTEMKIIGVMKNYNFQSLHSEIKPLGFTISPFFGSPNSYLIVNINSKDYPAVITRFKETWNKINPNSPFEYSFLDQDFQKNYEKETRVTQLVQVFTFLGILIACLGLFGLAAFSSEQRIREIGVRKVLGASVTRIVELLSMEFIKLVFIAILVAFPAGYFLLNQWLKGFAYRVDIVWWMYALAGATALLIALATVSFQTVKAAIANPVKSLRNE
ncbi:MAG: FtsX-like permease family protein, partial [Saprospiraceae bacterium]